MMNTAEKMQMLNAGAGGDNADNYASSTIWMGDLQKNMDEQFITQAFHACGEPVVNVRIIRNKQTGLLENYCFIELQNSSAARRAMLKLNGKNVPNTIPPRRFKLNFASFGREHLQIPEFSLHVSDLTDDVDDLTLYAGFSDKYRSVRSAKVVQDEGGRSRNFGFVRFSDQAEQQKALLEMHQASGIGKRLIKVSVAMPKRPPMGETAMYPNFSQYWQKYRDNYAAWQQYYASYYQFPYENKSDAVYAHHTHFSQHPDELEAQLTHWQKLHEKEDDTAEDPHESLDMDGTNHEFITRGEEMYSAIEQASFYPIDDLAVTLNSIPGV